MNMKIRRSIYVWQAKDGSEEAYTLVREHGRVSLAWSKNGWVLEQAGYDPVNIFKPTKGGAMTSAEQLLEERKRLQHHYESRMLQRHIKHENS